MQAQLEAHIDFETFSRVDLRKRGAYIYAADPSTEVLCASYAFGDEPVQRWLNGQPCPARLREHIESGGLIHAWNASFERIILWHCLARRHGWPRPKLEQFRCVMTQSYAMGFPGALGNAAIAMKMPVRKDDAGKRVMMQLCQPKADGSRYTPENAPAKFATLYAYCDMDVEVEREAGKRLAPLSARELEVWFMDQRMNDRGVYVNLPLVEGAKKVAEATKAGLVARIRDVTGYEVAGPSAIADLKVWLGKAGVSVGKELRATDIEDLLARDDLTDPAREALTIRQEFAKTSAAKLDAFLARMDPIDDRVRGTVQYHGASTGRFAARGLQTQNFPRPSKNADIALNIELLTEGDAEWVELMAGPPLSVIADTLRPMIQAEPG